MEMKISCAQDIINSFSEFKTIALKWGLVRGRHDASEVDISFTIGTLLVI